MLKHRDTETLSLLFKHKDTKVTKVFFWHKGDKRLKSRHKALRKEYFVDLVGSFAALCIFRLRKKTLFLCLFVLKKTLYLCASVFNTKKNKHD